jgi:hypothetical protein
MNERASSPEEQPEELRDELLTKPDSVTDDAPATVEDEVADPDHTDKLTLFSDDRTSPLEPISFVRKTADLNKEPMPEIHVAKRCEVGAIRERNEDACLVFMSDTSLLMAWGDIRMDILPAKLPHAWWPIRLSTKSISLYYERTRIRFKLLFKK